MSRQEAFNRLSDLITDAEILADREPDDEEELRDLIARAERVLDDLDDVEYELLEAIDAGYSE